MVESLPIPTVNDSLLSVIHKSQAAAVSGAAR
jgi:hypothetical protein